MRVKVGSVAFLKAAGSGYGIGLDADGHMVEFIGDWRALSALRELVDGADPIHIDIEEWQVLAVDDELRLPFLARRWPSARASSVRRLAAAVLS